jgi:Protein of unknown function (DUF2934)
MARVKTAGRVATATDRPPKSRAPRTNVTDPEIAQRAYDHFLARGCEHGHDVDDWLQAERELRGSVSAAAA